ncbi:MAG: radical SAM protein [Candidatus Pacearchaeota archaeon]
MKKISFRKGTTIIAHGDLLSFLHENDFKIFHRDYDNFEFNLYKNLLKMSELRLTKNDSLENKLNSFFESLIKTGFVEYISPQDKISNQYEVLKFNYPQMLHILVMVTNKCNMGCKYCYTESNRHLQEKELRGDEWIKLLETIKIPSRYRTQNISFTGGEPTLHPDFPYILKAISGKYKIEISSNGLEISDNLIDMLENFDGLNFFNISMDSYKESEDEFMRGSGTYERRLKNIKKLHERGIPLCIGVVVNSVTVKSLKETTKYFLEEFPRISMKYIPITKMGLALELDNSIFLSEKDARMYLDTLLQMKEKYSQRILIDPSSFYKKEEELHWSGRCSHMKFESERDLYLTSLSEKNTIVKSERCNAAYGVVAISSSGRLRPCLRADSFYSEIFNYVSRDILMPHINGLTREEIGRLPFWEIVKQKSFDFNPLKTCALKHHLATRGKKNGY